MYYRNEIAYGALPTFRSTAPYQDSLTERMNKRSLTPKEHNIESTDDGNYVTIQLAETCHKSVQTDLPLISPQQEGLYLFNNSKLFSKFFNELTSNFSFLTAFQEFVIRTLTSIKQTVSDQRSDINLLLDNHRQNTVVSAVEDLHTFDLPITTTELLKTLNTTLENAETRQQFVSSSHS